jgi:hypothetical protein
VIQILVFSLNESADENEFLACDQRLQADFAYQQPGLLRRTVAKNDRSWLVLDLWDSYENADTCDQKWDSDPLAQEWMGFVDRSTVRSSRFQELE